MPDPIRQVTYGDCSCKPQTNHQKIRGERGDRSTCPTCHRPLFCAKHGSNYADRVCGPGPCVQSPLPAKVTVHAGGRVTLEALRDAERERDHAEHRVEVMHRHYVEMMRQRDELRARTEQGGDIHALITDGHHMERLLTNALPILLHLDPNDLQDGAPFMDDEQLTDMVGAIRSGLYEWDKRARRSKVDWWNR